MRTLIGIVLTAVISAGWIFVMTIVVDDPLHLGHDFTIRTSNTLVLSGTPHVQIAGCSPFHYRNEAGETIFGKEVPVPLVVECEKYYTFENSISGGAWINQTGAAPTWRFESEGEMLFVLEKEHPGDKLIGIFLLSICGILIWILAMGATFGGDTPKANIETSM